MCLLKIYLCFSGLPFSNPIHRTQRTKNLPAVQLVNGIIDQVHLLLYFHGFWIAYHVVKTMSILAVDSWILFSLTARMSTLRELVVGFIYYLFLNFSMKFFFSVCVKFQDVLFYRDVLFLHQTRGYVFWVRNFLLIFFFHFCIKLQDCLHFSRGYSKQHVDNISYFVSHYSTLLILKCFVLFRHGHIVMWRPGGYIPLANFFFSFVLGKLSLLFKQIQHNRTKGHPPGITHTALPRQSPTSYRVSVFFSFFSLTMYKLWPSQNSPLL